MKRALSRKAPEMSTKPKRHGEPPEKTVVSTKWAETVDDPHRGIDAEEPPFHGKVLKIHSDYGDRAMRDDRELALDRFRHDTKDHLVMIATDLMGQGLDIPTIRFALNYDLL